MQGFGSQWHFLLASNILSGWSPTINSSLTITQKSQTSILNPSTESTILYFKYSTTQFCQNYLGVAYLHPICCWDSRSYTNARGKTWPSPKCSEVRWAGVAIHLYTRVERKENHGWRHGISQSSHEALEGVDTSSMLHHGLSEYLKLCWDHYNSYLGKCWRWTHLLDIIIHEGQVT